MQKKISKRGVRMKKIKIGLLGLGTVGTGVYKLINRRADIMEKTIGAELEIKKILVHNIDKKREGIDPSLLTDDWHEIIGDDEIQIVVEVMGGMEPARTIILEALRAGKNVVSANKDLIAEEGRVLLDTAQEHGKDFLFEAAVAGGIPIIRPLKQCLAANEISDVLGIVNGTTNYILTEMIQCGKSFAQALREAQQKGYAEADPTADVEGIDAGRKICILADLCFGKNVPPSSITTEGITKITPADIECARILGYKIKLLGRAMRTGPNSVSAFVAPHLVSKSNPLANVDGVINGISVKGDAVGEAMFFGPGAGAHPTASAVAGDIIDCVRDPSTRAYMGWWPSEPGYVTGPEKLSCRWMVRVVAPLSQIGAAFQGVRFIPAPNAEPDEYAFVTPYMPGEELSARMSGMDVRARYRVLD